LFGVWRIIEHQIKTDIIYFNNTSKIRWACFFPNGLGFPTDFYYFILLRAISIQFNEFIVHHL